MKSKVFNTNVPRTAVISNSASKDAGRVPVNLWNPPKVREGNPSTHGFASTRVLRLFGQCVAGRRPDSLGFDVTIRGLRPGGAPWPVVSRRKDDSRNAT